MIHYNSTSILNNMIQNQEQIKIDTTKSPSLNNKGQFNVYINGLDEKIKNMVLDVYNKLDDTKKKCFEREIIEDMSILEQEWWEVILLDKLANYSKQQSIEQNDEKTTKADEEEQNTWDKKERDLEEKQDSSEFVKSGIEIAKKTVDNFYKFFWWKDNLNDKLSEKWIKVDKLKDQARQNVLDDIKKDNKKRKKEGKEPLEVSEEDIATRTEVSFIASNKDKFVTFVPDNMRPQFESLYWNIISSAENLNISYTLTYNYNKPDLPKIITDHPSSTFVDKWSMIPEWTEVKRRWWELTYEQEDWTVCKVDFDDRPPTRYIVWDGIEIKVNKDDLKYTERYEFMVKKSELEDEIKKIKDSKPQLEKKKEQAKELFQKYNEKVENYNKWIFIDEKTGRDFSQDHDKEDLIKIAKRDLEEEKKQFNILMAEINILEEQQKLLPQKIQELEDVKKQEKDSIRKFRDSIKERDSIAKHNLEFITKSHLSVFWNSNIDRIIRLFNKYRPLDKDNSWKRPVDINEWFINSDKSIIINWMTKLLWWTQYFKDINEPISFIDWKLVDNKFITERLKSIWVFGGKDWTEINYSKIEQLLSTTGGKQDKSWKDSKAQSETKNQAK